MCVLVGLLEAQGPARERASSSTTSANANSRRLQSSMLVYFSRCAACCHHDVRRALVMGRVLEYW